MIIEESDFRLEYLGGYLFDLSLRVRRKKKDGTITDELEDAAHGCSLESAMKRIVMNRVCRKDSEGARTMRAYLASFKSEMKFLHNIFDGMEEEIDDGLE